MPRYYAVATVQTDTDHWRLCGVSPTHPLITSRVQLVTEAEADRLRNDTYTVLCLTARTYMLALRAEGIQMHVFGVRVRTIAQLREWLALRNDEQQPPDAATLHYPVSN